MPNWVLLTLSAQFSHPAWLDYNNNNELYLHDHTSSQNIAKAILRIKVTS